MKKVKMNIAVLLLLFIIGAIYLFAQHEHHQQGITTGQKIETEKVHLEEATIHTSAQCGSCKKRIEKAINEMEGIHYSQLDIETANLFVKYDSKLISLDDIRKEVTMTGYDADSLVANAVAYKKLPKCCQKGGHK